MTDFKTLSADQIADITASKVSDFDTEVTNNSAVTANTAKVTNATHTGEVTGSGALTMDTTSISNKTLDTALTGTENVLMLDGTLKKTTTQAIADLGGGSSFVGCSVYRSSNFSITSSSNNIIWNAEEYDIGNNYNTSTGEFTAPEDGYYAFNMYAYMTFNSYGGDILVVKNGTNIRSKRRNAKDSTISATIGITDNIYLTSGDTLAIRVNPNGAATILYSTKLNGGMEIIKIG